MTTVLAPDQLCGFCQTAWDLVYRRARSETSIGQWLAYCHRGGCDPDIWDFVDEAGDQTADRPPFVPSKWHRCDRSQPNSWKFDKRRRSAPIAQQERVSYTPAELYEKQLAEARAKKAKADEYEWADSVEELEDEEDMEWI